MYYSMVADVVVLFERLSGNSFIACMQSLIGTIDHLHLLLIVVLWFILVKECNP